MLPNVEPETEIIDLTVEETPEDFGHPPFNIEASDDTDEIIILNTTKVDEPGNGKHSAYLIGRHPKKQRLLETTQVSNEKKDGVLKVKDLFKPKGKKAIADMVLSDDVVEKRFKPLGGIQAFAINIPLAKLDMMVSRLFMANVYGGNSQETFPSVRQEKLAQHGMNDFMYLHLDYQPCAPQIPGRPGLWFNTAKGDHPFEARVLTRDLRRAMWQYVGQYEVRPAVSLTKEEWLKQEDKVKNTWTKQIRKKKWGRWLCARVQAHKEVEPGRKPTLQEVDDVFKSGQWENTTPDDVMAALNSGQVRLAVSTMMCIGYDHAFQLELCEKFPKWMPPPKEKKNKKSKSNTKKGVKKETKTPVRGKRKRVESDSEPDSIQELSDAKNDSDSDDD